MRTYWKNYPRGFANEYTLAVAHTDEHRQELEECGFELVSIRRETNKF